MAIFAGGSIGEGRERAGLANLTAAMLRRGTLSHSYDQINEVIEAEGASFAFGSGRHVLSLGGKSMVEDIDLVLELLAESLTQPAFDPEQLEQIRARVLTSIQEREHNTRAMASLNFRQAIYPPDHPYHTPLSGYEDTVSQISRDELPAFFEQFIGPADGVLVVVGALSVNDVITKLERTLGQWRQPLARPVWDTPPRPEVTQTVEIRKTDCRARAKATSCWAGPVSNVQTPITSRFCCAITFWGVWASADDWVTRFAKNRVWPITLTAHSGSIVGLAPGMQPPASTPKTLRKPCKQSGGNQTHLHGVGQR